MFWKPQDIFGIIEDTNWNSNTPTVTDHIDLVTVFTPISQSGKHRNDAFESDFKASVGGLQKQIDAIVRRVLDGRVLRPVQEDDNAAEDETTMALAAAALEAEELAVLGLSPVYSWIASIWSSRHQEDFVGPTNFPGIAGSDSQKCFGFGGWEDRKHSFGACSPKPRQSWPRAMGTAPKVLCTTW